MSGQLGSLVFALQADMVRTQEDMGRLNQIVENTMNRINASAMRTSKNVEGVARAGKTIGRMNGAEEAAKSIEKIGHTSTAARREMLVLAHELSQGNFKRFGGSLMVLGEQMDWMGKIMSPMGFTIGAVAGALIGLAAAAYKGAEASKDFQHSLTLTANFAGLTEARFNAMAQSIATSANVSIGSAREMTQAFVSTGRFGADSLQHVTTAAAMFAQVSGQKAEEVVKDFQRMADGPLKFALEMDKSTHFLTGALYDQIKKLEEAGDREQAMVVVSDAVVAALKRQGYEVEHTGVSWKGFTQWLSGAIDGLESFLGRSVTVDDRIAQIKSQLDALPQSGSITGGVRNGRADPRAALQSALNSAVRQKMREEDNALLESQRDTYRQNVVQAKQFMEEKARTLKTGAEQLAAQLKEIDRQGALAGTPQATIDAMKAKISKEFAPKGIKDLTKVDLTSQTKPLQDQIVAEDRLLTYRDQVLAKYYRNDKLSAEQYYDERVVVIGANIGRVKALYDQEIAITEQAAARTKDARTRKELETRADALRDEQAQAVLHADEQLALADEDRKRATDEYRQSVEKLTSELAKLSGQQGSMAGPDFDRQNKALKDQAALKNDTGALDTIARARAAAVAQGDMNALKLRAQVIEENLKTAEERNALLTETHQQSELDGNIRLEQMRRAAADQLEQIAQQEQAVADASALPTLIANADQFRIHVDQVRASSDILAKSINATFAEGFATILDNTIHKTKSLKESILDFGNTLEQMLTRLIAQDLFNCLFSAGGSSGGSSDGSGWIGKLIGIGLSAWAGGGASGSENLGASGSSTPDDLIRGYTGRASGGPVTRGGMYEVNERGPELLSIANRTFLMMGRDSGRVTPAGSSTSGGRSNVFNMNIAVPPGTTRQSAQQQAAEIMRHAQIAQARNA